jgi:hypothetical protein
MATYCRRVVHASMPAHTKLLSHVIANDGFDFSHPFITLLSCWCDELKQLITITQFEATSHFSFKSNSSSSKTTKQQQRA